MKFSDHQIKTAISAMHKELGRAWDFMVPEVREAFVCSRTLYMVIARDEPGQVATSEVVNDLRIRMLKAAGLIDDAEPEER